jgi:hypothetical protein
MTKTAPLGHSTLAADPFALAARVALWLSGIVAVATMAAALYIQIPSMRAGDAASPVAPHETIQQRWAAVAEEPEPEPVRVANPFDASEIFEFPAGTSHAEARASMAEMLLERARERYARLDSRSQKTR